MGSCCLLCAWNHVKMRQSNKEWLDNSILLICKCRLLNLEIWNTHYVDTRNDSCWGWRCVWNIDRINKSQRLPVVEWKIYLLVPYSTVQYTSVLSEDSEDDVCVFPVAAYVMTSKNNRVWYRTYLSNWILYSSTQTTKTERNGTRIRLWTPNNLQLPTSGMWHVTYVSYGWRKTTTVSRHKTTPRDSI